MTTEPTLLPTRHEKDALVRVDDLTSPFYGREFQVLYHEIRENRRYYRVRSSGLDDDRPTYYFHEGQLAEVHF